MWRCPRCGQTFVSRNLPHSCAVVPLDAHFAGSAPAVREAFDALVAAVPGPVTINATKSRVTLQARMRFAAVDAPRREWLTGHLVLTRAVPCDAIERVDFLAPHYHLHRFRLRGPGDVEPLRELIAEAYAFGR
jgi:hypothetical protein